MTNTATTRARAARWAGSDASVPYFDDRLARLNGTNRAGRRPHSFLEPTRKTVFALIAANDNQEVGGASDPSGDAGSGTGPLPKRTKPQFKI